MTGPGLVWLVYAETGSYGAPWDLCEHRRVPAATDPVLRRSAAAAAGLALASAATSAYWVFGGTALLDTVGGYAEDLARTRSPSAMLVGLLVIGVKVAGAVLALALADADAMRRFRLPLLLANGFGSALLIVYGGLLVAVGALVLTGAVEPDGPVDRRALTWHVVLWDLWFLLWGLALALATWRASRSARQP